MLKATDIHPFRERESIIQLHMINLLRLAVGIGEVVLLIMKWK